MYSYNNQNLPRRAKVSELQKAITLADDDKLTHQSLNSISDA